MSRGAGLTELAAIVDAFLPAHGEFSGPIYKQPSPSAAEYSIRDYVTEAAQLLEHAGLLVPKHYESNGNWDPPRLGDDATRADGAGRWVGREPRRGVGAAGIAMCRTAPP